MGNGLMAYLSRDYFRKIEMKVNMKAILACWAFNIVVAFFVALSTWLITSNPIVTVLYTLSAWACTLIISVVYWLFWIRKRLGNVRIRVLASGLIILMLAAGLGVLWQTIVLLVQVAQL